MLICLNNTPTPTFKKMKTCKSYSSFSKTQWNVHKVTVLPSIAAAWVFTTNMELGDSSMTFIWGKQKYGDISDHLCFVMLNALTYQASGGSYHL